MLFPVTNNHDKEVSFLQFLDFGTFNLIDFWPFLWLDCLRCNLNNLCLFCIF